MTTKKYSKASQDKVKRAMHEMKEGTLKSGKSGQKVTSRKQAVAIGLSEARKEGAKVPAQKSASSQDKKLIVNRTKHARARRKAKRK